MRRKIGGTGGARSVDDSRSDPAGDRHAARPGTLRDLRPDRRGLLCREDRRAGIIADPAVDLLDQRRRPSSASERIRSSAPSASRRKGPDRVATRQIQARIRIKVDNSFIRPLCSCQAP